MGVIYFLPLSCLGLIITAQAQNCSTPVAGPNMNLKDKDILLKTFPDGIQVAFACDVGHTSAGGSPVITCTAGTWSPVRLQCQRKNCGAFDRVENGQADYPEGTEFGDKVVITCNTGYKFVGKPGIREIFCGDGAWNSRPPVCEVVTCEPPPVIADGIFSPNKDSYAYREVVQYSCQKDFTLSGSNSRSCSDDGTFRPDPPTCVMVQCEDIDIKNADWIQGSRPPYGYKSTVTFKCKTGYTMIGEPTQICEINSQWSPGLPSCTPVACGPPPMIPGGTFGPSKSSYTYREAVRYTCEKGFTLSGSDSISCSEDGTFKPEPPTCVRKTSPTKPTTTTKKPTVTGTSETPGNEGNSFVIPLVISLVVAVIGGFTIYGLCRFCGVPAIIKKKRGKRHSPVSPTLLAVKMTG